MKTTKSMQLALNILLHSKLRSWLTIIGIVIGVAAVVAIVSIGQGLQQSVQNRLGGLGADIVTISPGGGRASGGFRGFGGGEGPGGGNGATSSDAKNLTKKDVQALQRVSNIAYMQGTIGGRAETYYLGEKATLSVQGVDPQVWPHMTTSELDSGRLLGPSDRNVVVVGSRIAANTFKEPLSINRDLTIEGKSFKIVGVLKESGSPGGDDNAIVMPIDAARDILENKEGDMYDSITIKTTSADAVDQVSADADTTLATFRHVQAKKDFRISSAKATQERISSITDTMTYFLGAIAAVSLLVGAVGIANTMFTSVLEKTKQIGTMKAIGATNKDIMMIFMLNAALVGLVGGLLGVGLGAALSSALPLLGVRIMGGPGGGTLNTALTPSLLIGALLLAVAIGILAGAIPAYRASKLKPAIALRYE